jgi:tetratricopeptide (TPR) repeat protein
MEEHIQLTPMVATHCIHRRGELAYHNGDYDEAIAYAQQILSKQSDDDSGAAHRLLRTVYFAQGKIQEAYQQAQLMAKVSRYNMIDTADALLWQAALAQRQGSTQTALFAYLRGQDLYTRHDLPRWIEPYDAICDYLEQSQQAPAALKIRAEQVETYKTYGSEWYESHANLEYCRLLGRMGKSLDEALEHARTVAEKLVKPDPYRAALQRIESGNYHPFDWQE